MKKIFLPFILIFIIIPLNARQAQKSFNSQNLSPEKIQFLNAAQLLEQQTQLKNAQKSDWLKTVYLEMEEGFTWANITRIQTATERSNFVWNDMLIGAYYTIRTQELPFLDLALRLQFFYPYQHKFNEMQQYSKQVILYAFDGFFGPYFKWNLFKHFNFSITAGAHCMYQLSDEYHLIYLGAGSILGLEFPVTRRWTITSSAGFTWDNANAGTNRLVQPFDYSWQWNINLGVKYSKNHPSW